MTIFVHIFLSSWEPFRGAVFQTYYTTEGFANLVCQCGLEITNKVRVGRYSENEREVVVLRRV